ncbi:MAG: hypothetical protein K0Q72_419 [Armatimonadetes bacterium]|nr:hypothetical protein [Armatimonadota bacterium]
MQRPVDAILMAGGRISGEYAQAAGTEIKALVSVAGQPVLRRVAEALHAAPGIGRVCVVGPVAVRAEVAGLAEWQPETETAFGNFQAGAEFLGTAGSDRVLLCGTDTPCLTPAAIQDFLQRAPDQADICLALVGRERFEQRFAEGRWVYVPLADGHFTGGSQFLVRPRVLIENAHLIQRLFSQRKSQLGMAATLGLSCVIKLLLRRLRVSDLEARASFLTGCHCRAVPDCAPELALDIDNQAEWEYAARVCSG